MSTFPTVTAPVLPAAFTAAGRKRRPENPKRIQVQFPAELLETLDVDTLTPRELVEFIKAGMDIETRIYGLNAAAGEQRPVQIVLDSRLLPPGARLPEPTGPGATL